MRNIAQYTSKKHCAILRIPKHAIPIRRIQANPDLVARWQSGVAVNAPDMDTFYTLGRPLAFSMSLSEGFQLENPPAFIPWGISELWLASPYKRAPLGAPFTKGGA
ncbi:MAG: hypothetical protein AABY73_12685 [Pseudomonadota bacterium]